jgi:disulfide oxidoreductase YuzD
MSKQVKWQDDPDAHDYPAAESYLSLLYPRKVVCDLIAELHNRKTTEFKAKDIFRASGLSLLGISNYHVRSNVKKIKNGESLSPLLLVQDSRSNKLVIADGYHRLCAVYRVSEDQLIKCKIVEVKSWVS